MKTNSKTKRLYQVWKGSNKFVCGGRLIFGPDAASLLLTTLLIAGPSFAFCCQSILKINYHANTLKNNAQEGDCILSLPVLTVAAIVTLSNLISLYLTSGRDPGIVPRNAKPLSELDDGIDSTTPSMEWVHGRTPGKIPRIKEVVVRNFTVKVKYCDTCFLYRPPRASHCSICNNCVQKFDHHCPWVGQCIGLRNYRFFFLFISTSTFLCLYIFIFSWLNIIEQRRYSSFLKAMRREIFSLILIIYTFFAVWFVGGLTVFHLYLIGTNQTTYENFRYRYDKNENPYNKGILGNFKEVFFSSIPPSMNNFRSLVVEGQDDIVPEPSSIVIDINSKNDKTASSMNIKVPAGNKTVVPLLLQNVDCSTTGTDSDVLSRPSVDPSVDSVDLFPFIYHQKTHTRGHDEYNNGLQNLTNETGFKGTEFGASASDIRKKNDSNALWK